MPTICMYQGLDALPGLMFWRLRLVSKVLIDSRMSIILSELRLPGCVERFTTVRSATKQMQVLSRKGNQKTVDTVTATSQSSKTSIRGSETLDGRQANKQKEHMHVRTALLGNVGGAAHSVRVNHWPVFSVGQRRRKPTNRVCPQPKAWSKHEEGRSSWKSVQRVTPDLGLDSNVSPWTHFALSAQLVEKLGW